MSGLSKKGIEDSLNIPSAEELTKALELLNQNNLNQELYVPEEEQTEEDLSVDEMKSLIKEAREARQELRKEPNILARQKRLEDISAMSTKYFERVMDKAFNTEDRYAADLLSSAATLLKVAADAESNLINSDTKMAELQLKKEKQDADLNKMSLDGNVKDIAGEAVVMIDRNSLFKEFGKDK